MDVVFLVTVGIKPELRIRVDNFNEISVELNGCSRFGGDFNWPGWGNFFGKLEKFVSQIPFDTAFSF